MASSFNLLHGLFLTHLLYLWNIYGLFLNFGELWRNFEEICRFFENVVSLLNFSSFLNFLLIFETWSLHCWIEWTSLVLFSFIFWCIVWKNYTSDLPISWVLSFCQLFLTLLSVRSNILMTKPFWLHRVVWVIIRLHVKAKKILMTTCLLYFLANLFLETLKLVASLSKPGIKPWVLLTFVSYLQFLMVTSIGLFLRNLIGNLK